MFDDEWRNIMLTEMENADGIVESRGPLLNIRVDFHVSELHPQVSVKKVLVRGYVEIPGGRREV